MQQDEKSSSWGTSSTLIQRVRAKDKEAWKSLCEIYAPLVYSWARAKRLQESDAEDVVQEVLKSVARGLQDFQHGGPSDSFRGWLWTITLNVLRRYFNNLRDDLVRAEGGTDALQAIGDIPERLDIPEGLWEVEPQLDAGEEIAMLRRGLKLIEQDFSEQTWKAFWQFAVNERSARDVAEEFGMTPEAVRRAKYRVMARLREVLP